MKCVRGVAAPAARAMPVRPAENGRQVSLAKAPRQFQDKTWPNVRLASAPPAITAFARPDRIYQAASEIAWALEAQALEAHHAGPVMPKLCAIALAAPLPMKRGI